MSIYLPPHFEQTDAAAVSNLIASFPLATIVTTTESGIVANHIPMQFSPCERTHGVLRGHVARNNQVWRSTNPGVQTLAIFQAPDAYISPNWYETKRTTHEVVPTWNYAVVHLYGDIQFHDDEKWLRGVIGKLTRSMESDQPKPWNMAQAPRAYLASQLDEIVGVEIEVTSVIAKWKVSQNRNEADRQGAIEGLREACGPNREWIASTIEGQK